MAKYSQPHIAQLFVSEVPKHLTILQYRYRVTIKSPDKKRNSVSQKLSFLKSAKTNVIKVLDDQEKVQVDIYLNDIWMGGYILRHYKKDAKIAYDQTRIKSTTAQNSESPNHVKEVKITQDAEVGWKLIKKEQTFDELLREVYKKVPNRTELDIFRHVNAHLGDLQDLNLSKKIKPGQIILIANKKSSPELTEYKKLALEAEHIFKRYSRNANFDPVFFANNFELLLDYLSFAKQVQVARIEYLKTVESHKESYCVPVTFDAKVESLNATATYSSETKSKMDDLKFQAANTKAVNQLSQELQKVEMGYSQFLKEKGLPNNSNSYQRFAHQRHDLYQKLNTVLAQNFATNYDNKDFARVMRNVVKDTSGVRGKEFMGGLSLHVKAMDDIAKATISLKIGGYLVLAYTVAQSGLNVYGAYQTNDMDYTLKVTVVESLSVGGGLLGGYWGASLGSGMAIAGTVLLGISTGGLSLIIIGGVGAAIGGVAGGIGGTMAGNATGRYLTKVCD